MPTRVLLRDSQIPETCCPYCGLKINAAAYAGNETPTSGDVSMCIRCNELSEFGSDLQLRPLSKPVSEMERGELKKACRLLDWMKAAGFR